MTGGLSNHHYTVTWQSTYEGTCFWNESLFFAEAAAQDVLLQHPDSFCPAGLLIFTQNLRHNRLPGWGVDNRAPGVDTGYDNRQEGFSGRCGSGYTLHLPPRSSILPGCYVPDPQHWQMLPAHPYPSLPPGP